LFGIVNFVDINGSGDRLSSDDSEVFGEEAFGESESVSGDDDDHESDEEEMTIAV